MLQCDKQTFVDFPKHAEILVLILAGETEPEGDLGMTTGWGIWLLILPLCANQLYYLHQIFPQLQFIHLHLGPPGSTVKLLMT